MLVDQKEKELVGLVVSMGGQMDADDERLDQFCDDRGIGEDTINRVFNKGYLRQVGAEDNFTIELARFQRRGDMRDLKDRVGWLESEMQRITECKQCMGSGCYLQDECDVCHGTGKNPATEQA